MGGGGKGGMRPVGSRGLGLCSAVRFRVQGSGLRACRVQGAGLRVEHSGFWAYGILAGSWYLFPIITVLMTIFGHLRGLSVGCNFSYRRWVISTMNLQATLNHKLPKRPKP